MVGCGGGGGEPLVQSNVTGTVDGVDLGAAFGISVEREVDGVTDVVTMIGSGEINCGSIDNALPPEGVYVSIQLPAAVEGPASSASFAYWTVEGNNFDLTSSGGGTVTVTSVTDATIAMDVDHSATIDGVDYAVSGQFEAIRCH